MAILKRAFALLLPLWLTACMVGPHFKPPAAPAGAQFAPAPLPARTAAVAGGLGGAQRFDVGADIPGEWWTLLRSRPLDRLISRAFKRSPTIAAAQAALTQAQENMLAQGGMLYPSIGASTSQSRNETPTAALTPIAARGQRLYSLYTAGLSVGYSPDVFGLDRRLVESAGAQAANRRYELEAAYLSLSSNIVVAAIDLASLGAQIRAQRQIVTSETEVLQRLRREAQVGELAKTDLLQQEAMLAQAKAALPPLIEHLALQRNALIALTGGFPNEDLDDDFALARLRLPQDLPVSLPSRLIDQRPDILAASAMLHAASAQVGVAIAERLPRISLSAGFGMTSLGFAHALTPYNQFFSLIGGAALPLFEGGRLLHRQRAAQAAFEQAAAEYRATVITAFRNVADALQRLQADARSLQATAAAEQAAGNALRAAQRRLEVGESSYLLALMAQQRYEAARIATIQARAMRLTDTAALFQALGGGWWNRHDALGTRSARLSRRARGPGPAFAGTRSRSGNTALRRYNRNLVSGG